MNSSSAEAPSRTGISGSLEDVSVADVMQFIHLGHRTGTLVLSSHGQAARIGFHGGKLISARVPGQVKLGDLLVEQGLVDREALEDALANETLGEERRSIGQILLADGFVAAEELREVVVRQIEEAVSQVVHWDHGSFEFALNQVRPVDDVALYPGDLVPDADLNTQMVLLEAARIFDEARSVRHDDEQGEGTEPAVGRLPGPPSAAVAGPADNGDETWPGTDFVGLDEARIEISGAGGGDAPELHVVSSDEAVVRELGQVVRQQVSEVRRMSLSQAGVLAGRGAGRGDAAASVAAPVVVLDLRRSERTPDDLRRLRRERPWASIVALVEPGPRIAEAYAAGAVAALPADPRAVLACVENIVRSRRELASAVVSRPAVGRRSDQGVARLRRVFGDLRSGLISATVALNLMHIISESVERAVLLLVKRDLLIALGAFGSGPDGRPLAELTRGLRLDLGAQNVLTESVLTESQAGPEARRVDFDAGRLPVELTELLGRPANGQAVVFPVLGAQRVISVIYTDNGDRQAAIEDVEILELATAQVGMAFENELLRRQIDVAEG